MAFISESKKGFTIIELIISIFILSVAVVGIFGAFSMVSVLTADATNKLTATYLAQEGMEIVRNIRDSNWLYIDANPDGGMNWDESLDNCESAGCEVDYETTGQNAISQHFPQPYITGDYLSQTSLINPDSTTVAGFYGYTSRGTQTIFKRKVTISCLPTGTCANDYIMKVIVQVSWDQKATILNPFRLAGTSDCSSSPSNCVKIETTLYNWYKYNLPTPPSVTP